MKLLRIFCVLALALLMVHCGEDKKQDEKDTSVKIGGKKDTKKSDSNSQTIALSGNDLMQFDKKEFKVKAGQEITLNFRHSGKMDLKVMGHNFVLLKSGTVINEFAQAAAQAGEGADWIPNEGNEVLAHTKMLGGGQSTSITFTAPEAGTYDFICSFPGHSGLMQGKFIVE